MLLTYRGITYNRPENPVTTAPGNVMGFYRGAAWFEQTLTSELPTAAVNTLCWRGVRYNTDGSPLPQTIETQAPIPTAKVQPPAANLGHTHRDWILKSLEHRMSVARDRGDQHLVQMLEDEWKQFA